MLASAVGFPAVVDVFSQWTKFALVFAPPPTARGRQRRGDQGDSDCGRQMRIEILRLSFGKAGCEAAIEGSFLFFFFSYLGDKISGWVRRRMEKQQIGRKRVSGLEDDFVDPAQSALQHK